MQIKKKNGFRFPDFVINFRQNIQLNKQNNYIHIFPRDPRLHIYRWTLEKQKVKHLKIRKCTMTP